MKLFLWVTILLAAFLSPAAIAQGRGPSGGGGSGFHGPPHFGGLRGGHPQDFGRGRGFSSAGGWGGWGYPAFFSDYEQWGSFENSNTPMAVVVVVEQPPPPVVEPPAPPPDPPRPVVQSYNWPAAPGDDSPGFFSIVRTDGTVHSAIATWVQDGVLHYTEPNGATEQTPLDAIDRAATRHLNAANGLNLRLPADPSARRTQAGQDVSIQLTHNVPAGK